MVCAALLVVYTGCGASNDAGDKYMSMESSSAQETVTNSSGIYKESADVKYEYDMVEKPGTAEETGTSSGQSVSTNRKLIKTVEIDVETKEFEALLDNLQKRINDCGGYIEQMNTYNGSAYSNWRGSRSASLTVRVPQTQLEAFLADLSANSNVVRRNDKVEDVTLTYVDMESRKQALEVEQDRLLELLSQAKSIEDIITIEERLSNVRYQIESMGSQLRTYDNLVEYSTVRLSIEEVKELTPVEEESLWERIGGGFVDSIKDIGDDLVEIGVWIVVNSPYLVLWALVIVVVVLVVRRDSRRRKERSLKKQMSEEDEND